MQQDIDMELGPQESQREKLISNPQESQQIDAVEAVCPQCKSCCESRYINLKTSCQVECSNCNTKWCTVCRKYADEMHDIHDEKVHYHLMCSLIHSAYFGTSSPFDFGFRLRVLVVVLSVALVPVIIIIFFKIWVALGVLAWLLFFLLQYIILCYRLVMLAYVQKYSSIRSQHIQLRIDIQS